jgi:CubicO group peptidase (beta-lactamase class C family)
MKELRDGTAAEVGMVPERVAHIRARANSWVEDDVTPALVVLAARRGVIVLHEAFGRLRPEPDAPPLRTDSIYPIRSMAKPITATAAMLLVEDGALGLNRPVRDYLPEVSGAGSEEVLVHHLLTHSSGYSDAEALPAFAERYKAGIDAGPCEPTEHPVIRLRLSVSYPMPVTKPPGTEMIYCDTNYEFIGESVLQRNGRSSM